MTNNSTNPSIVNGHQGLQSGLYGSDEAKVALFAAILALQTKGLTVAKDAAPLSPYAKLKAACAVLKPELNALALVFVQMVDCDALVSLLSHKAGATLISRMPLLLTSLDMQAQDCAITCARRNAMGALFNLHTHDEEGSAEIAATSVAAPAKAGVSAKACPISDPTHADVSVSLGKIAGLTTLDLLQSAKAFAPQKYVGEALVLINKEIDSRIAAVQAAANQGATPTPT